jgi:hypothetical protein
LAQASRRSGAGDERFPVNSLKSLHIPLLARLVLSLSHQAGLSLRFADGV